MRSITRNALVVLLAIVVLLLALGVLPGFLKSGDPYYVTATQTDETLPDENATMVDAANLSEQTYRYTWSAIERAGNGSEGRSDPYWRGPIGLKEAFTHSPFDEIDGLRTRYPTTFVDDAALVRWDDRTYRIAVIGG